MASQDTSGIFIQRVNPFQYNTIIRRTGEQDIISFIPFRHNHEVDYLGSIGFLDMSTGQFHISALSNMNKGLLSNHFYPLGGTPSETRPDLLGKGLARRIEFEVAKDLLKQFSEDTPIAIAATSDNRKNYCRKVGLATFHPMPLRQYYDILQRSIR